MRYHGIFALLAFSSVLGGCAGYETQTTSGATSTGTPGETANALTFQTGKFEVPAGDSFECFYTDTITDKELKKVQVAIQSDQLRVSSPSRDELQGVMALLRQHDFGMELNFGNYRG